MGDVRRKLSELVSVDCSLLTMARGKEEEEEEEKKSRIGGGEAYAVDVTGCSGEGTRLLL
jgi:hypothetical protein